MRVAVFVNTEFVDHCDHFRVSHGCVSWNTDQVFIKTRDSAPSDAAVFRRLPDKRFVVISDYIHCADDTVSVSQRSL